MAAGSEPPEPVLPARLRRAFPDLAFAAVLAASVADLASVAFIERHWDEDAAVVIGWLLSRGKVLYRDVFSHHAPLDYLIPWAAARAGAPGAARVAMLGVWAALAALFYATRRRRGEPAAAAWLFAVLGSQWLVYWMGGLVLVENLWGAACAAALILLGGPLGRPALPSRGEAAAFGLLLGLIACAGPVALGAAVLLAAWAAADRGWRAAWKPAAGGLAAWALLFGGWCALHADARLMRADLWTFNARVYARWLGFSGPFDLPARAVREVGVYFLRTFAWRSVGDYFECLLRLGVLAAVLRPLARGRPWAAVWWAALAVVLKARSERLPGAVPFHSAPFFLVASLAFCEGAAALWERAASGSGPKRRAAFVLAGALALAPTVAATSSAVAALRPLAAPDREDEEAAALLRACVGEGESIAVLPVAPRLYLEAGREPGVPNVFYFPWQEDWAPQREATAAALRSGRPAAVVTRPERLWGKDWPDGARAVFAALETAYAPAARLGPRGTVLWVRAGDRTRAECFARGRP